MGRRPTLPIPNREDLETLYNGGLTLPQIGKILGTSSSAVQRWMVKYGIKRRESSWSEEETATLKEFYPRGEKETLVARLENRTWEGIKQKAAKLGLRFPRTKYMFSREELEKSYDQMGAPRASGHLGVEQDTFYYLLRKNGIPTRKRGCPDLRPSVDLLYLLGVLKGDGFTRIREKAPCYYLIGLGTISEKFARAFADALRNIGLNPHLYSHNPPSGHSKKHVSYSVKASSKEFVMWYRNLSYDDIKKMIGETKDFATAFVRGFYESEGTYYIRDGKHPILKIGNTNLQVLAMVRDFILQLGIHVNLGLSGRTKKGKEYWYLHKCGEDVLRFINMVKSCIKSEPSNLEPLRNNEGEVLCRQST